MPLTLLHEQSVGPAVDALSRMPDGRLLASVRFGAPSAIDLSTFATERLGAEGHQPWHRLHALAPGGPAAFLGFDEPDLVFIDTEGYNVEQRKSGTRRGSTQHIGVALHPGGLHFAFNDHKCVVNVHDVVKARNVTYKGLSERIGSVRFDATGTRIAAASQKQAAVWDVKTRKPTMIDVDVPYTFSTTTMEFSPDGTEVAANLHHWDRDPASKARYLVGFFSLATRTLTREIEPERSVNHVRYLDPDHLVVSSGLGLQRHFVEVLRASDGVSLGHHEVPRYQRDLWLLGDGRFAAGGDDGTLRVFRFTA